MNDFSEIILDKKGRDRMMLEAVSVYQTENSLPGIKAFHLQGKLGWYNTTFNLHLKRLIENRLLQNISKGLISITKLGEKVCAQPLIEANESVAKKERRKPTKLEKEITAREKIKFHLLYHAGTGVTFETVRSDRWITPSTNLTEILLNQIISITPYSKANGILLILQKA